MTGSRNFAFGGFGSSSFPTQPTAQTKKRITPYGESGLQNVLHFLMKSPTDQLLKYLLSLNIDYNQLDDQKRSPLALFIEYNREKELFDLAKGIKTNVEILNEILRVGFKTETKDLVGNSPMLLAIKKGLFEFAKVLGQYHANINTMNNIGENALKHWVVQKNVKNVELLLRMGADPNFKDNKSRSALHHAVNVANADADASFEMESLLLQYGADINLLDKNHRTPLYYSFVKIGKPFENTMIDPVETVSSIMGVTSCRKDIADNWGKTPLHYAAQRGSNISGIYLLNSKEIDIEARDHDNNTALAIAFLNKHSNFATLLIQNGANILTSLVYVPVRKDSSNNKTEENNPFNHRNFMNINYNNNFKAQIQEDSNEENESESGDPSKSEKKSNAMDLESHSSESEESSLDNSPLIQPQTQQQWGGGFQGFNFQYGQPQAVVQGDLKPGKTYSYFLSAIIYQWQGVSYLLIQQGYNIMDAIESALTEKKFQLVLTLLSKKSDKASFQSLNQKNQNLFHLFAIYGRECSEEIREKICKELLFREITLDQKDKKGRIPLHYSSAKGFEKLSQFFLENQCNPEELDLEGNSPLSLLMQSNQNASEYR